MFKERSGGHSSIFFMKMVDGKNIGSKVPIESTILSNNFTL
jgi:hypothetical protein